VELVAIFIQEGPRRWRASLRESELLLDAIERGDDEAARTISARGMDAAMRYQEKTAPEQLNAPVRWIAAD
jgi:DNA-binding GntR family transcriptional regulator